MLKTLIPTLLLIISTFITISTSALPATFDKNLVLSDQDLYSLPEQFSSESKIQTYLESQNSVLATTTFDVGFIDNGGNDPIITDDIILDSTQKNIPKELSPRAQVQDQFGNKKLKASTIIWKLSRENFGNSCALNYSKNGVLLGVDSSNCINNSVQPINPAFVLTMIQKESSLVFGACAKPDADTNLACEFSVPNSINKLSFRQDRAMGYWCFEREKAQSCYDENPIWKYHKGFFKQIYKGIRLLRMRIQTCNTVGFYQYKTGATVFVDNEQVTLQNGITCSLYIYTPHIVPDKTNLYDILKKLGTQNTVEIPRKPQSPVVQPTPPAPIPTTPPQPQKPAITNKPISKFIRKVKPF
jgi:hypothetical protein